MNSKRILSQTKFAIIWIVLLSCLLLRQSGVDAQTPQPNRILSLAWNATGSELVGGSADGNVYLWDISGNLLHTLTGHTDKVFGVAWSANSTTATWVASGSLDGTIRIWDASNGSLLHLLGPIGTVTALTWIPNSNQLISMSSQNERGSLLVWDAASGQLLSSHQGGDTGQLVWSFDRRFIAFPNAGGVIAFINAATLEGVGFNSIEHFPEVSDSYYSVDWLPSPNIYHLASGSLDGTVRIWDVSTNQILESFRGNDSPTVSYDTSLVYGVHFSADGSTLYSISADGTIRAWDVASQERVVNTQVPAPVYAAAWSPDGSKLAYGGVGSTVQVIPTPERPTPTPTNTPTFTPTPTATPTFTPTPTPTPTPTFTPTATPNPVLTSYDSPNQDANVALRQATSYTADQCSGGTASDSSHLSGHGAANAFDNNASSVWQPSGSGAGWIEYNFGVNHTIRRYTMRVGNGGNGTSTLQYFDGATWQTADSRSVSFNTGEKQTFDVGSDHTAARWRLIFPFWVSIVGPLQIAEIEMIELATVNHDTLVQSFQISSGATVGRVRLWLKKVGSPAGNLTLSIQTDSSGHPSGAAVTNGISATVAASSLGTGYSWVDFTFATPPSLSAGTSYWLALTTTDAASTTNYVQWGADGSSPGYGSGQMMSQTGGTWGAENKDAVFEVRSS